MSLVFVRHGETALNVARIVQPAETPLSPRGLLQAERVAERLRSVEVGAIVSSDLPRALETARRIAAHHRAPLDVDLIWRERDFGAWRGRRWSELGFDPRTADVAPPGGESSAAFAERVALAFSRLVARNPAAAGAVVVVSHGLVIRLLLESHLVRPAPGSLTLGNTSVTIASREAPHTVSVLDCLDHLDDKSRHDDTSVAGI